MSTMQIRNVPEDVARVTKARAAMQGVSLSEYLLELVTEHASAPTLDEMRERLLQRLHPDVDASAAEAIRRDRDSRDARR